MNLEQLKKENRERLEPKVDWIPRSEQEYLQRQKLLPVFKGWLNQIWKAQEPHVDQITTTSYQAGIDEAVEICWRYCGKDASDNLEDAIKQEKERIKALTNPKN